VKRRSAKQDFATWAFLKRNSTKFDFAIQDSAKLC